MKKLEKESLKNGERTTLWLSRIVIWVVIMVVMFPALWIIMASFSKGDSFFMTSLIPEQLGVGNYVSLFKETDFMLWVFNSLKLCLIVAIIQLILTSLAAYAFSRMRFSGKIKRSYGLVGVAGISEQYGISRILHIDLQIWFGG